MDVIPVIDVRHGLAVAAVRGQRADYRPLVTPLSKGSEPADVARGYAALFTFPVLYVADLDGIEGRGRNESLPAHLAGAVPGMRLWIDDGTPARAAAQRIADERHATLVIGSESLQRRGRRRRSACAAARPLRAFARFQGRPFDGPGAVLEEPQHWPHNVIVMTLARVGSGAGPDLQRVAAIVSRAGEPAHLCCRRRAQPRRHRSAARGRRGRRAHRHGAACRNDKGRRSPGDRRPLMS